MTRTPTHQSRSERRDRGAVIPLIALVLPVLVLMTAFAVDLGKQRADRRSMQAAADVIALDMVRIVDGRPLDEVHNDPDTQLELSRSADRNGLVNATLSPLSGPRVTLLEWGTLGAGTHDFVPLDPGDAADAATVPEAARVTTEDTTDYAFQPGSGSVTRTAVASLSDFAEAEFLLGSTLVSMSPTSNWIVGRVLQQIIPGADLIGYQGLANANITLASLATALNLGSPDELANTTVTYKQLLVASATALQADDGSADDKAAAVSILDELAALSVQDFYVGLGEVLGLGTVDGNGLTGSVAIPQLLLSGVAVANGIQAISIPGTVLNVAGLADVTLDLSAIEPPVRIGRAEGASDSTDQLELGVTIYVDISGDKDQEECELPNGEQSILRSLLGLTGLVDCLLNPTRLLEVDVGGRIDLDVTLGEVTGTQRIDCAASRLNIEYDTQPVGIAVNASLDAKAYWDGTLLTNLLEIQPVTNSVQADGTSGSVSFQPTDVGPKHLAFEQVYADDSTGGPTARVGAPYLGLPSLLNTAGIQITVADQDLPELGLIAKGLVEPMLNDIINEVDQQIIAELSRLLGLNLGGADITPQSMQCEDNGVKLVG